MNNDDFPQGPRSPALRVALRVLGNPYASLQTYEVPEIRSLTAKERAYKLRLEDPYASLSIGISDVASSAPSKARGDKIPAGISMVEFEKGCRRIFRQYIPAIEKGCLRHHHAGFIDRHVGRAPGIRAALLVELCKFDLDDIRGFRARFNRERNPFTEAKLRDIELKVNRPKK